MDNIVNIAGTVMNAADTILTGLLLLAALTPTVADDTILGRVKNLVGLLKRFVPGR